MGSLKTIHGSAMNNKENLTPQDRLKLAPIQHSTYVQQCSCPFILQKRKSKLEVKTKQYKYEITDLGQAQTCGVFKVLWCDQNHPPFKSGHCGKNNTQLNTPKIILKRSESVVKQK